MKYIFLVMFLVLFASILFGMHYYVLSRMLGFFGITTKIWLFALILSLIFPIATIIDRSAHSSITAGFYYSASVMAGFFFICFFAILLLELINLFFPVFARAAVGYSVLIIVLLLSAYAVINAATPRVAEIEVPGFEKNMRVVQLSDVHIGTINNEKYLSRIVEKTNNLRPDIVVITGDLFDGSGKLNLSVLSPLSQIKAPVYMIMGNHEFYEGESSVIKLMNHTNVTALRNDAVLVKGIQIIGLDYSENKSYVGNQLDKMRVNTSVPTILLNHVPLGYMDAKERGIRLQLSGHTHAGQIFPFTLAVRAVFPKYRGLYNFGNFTLYVSEGTGTWGPPMRLGTKSEITLIKLAK